MNRRTWTDRRARVFARGLYHVASCDGLDAREAQALQAFMVQLELDPDLEALAHEPFDYTEAAQVLDSTWLRRTLVHACRLMAQMDGEISANERDTLRTLGAALGVGERFALHDLEGEAPAPEQLAAWIGALAVDFVSWDDDHQAGYFWKFPHESHPLAQGAPLIVERGQALVVQHCDAITDVLGPGDYTVDPDVLPGLAAVADWFQGPVEARLLFLRTGPSPRLRWGTAASVAVNLSGHGQVPIRAYGRFCVRFCDAREVVSRMARHAVPDDVEVEQRLRRIITGRFANQLAQLPDLTAAELNDLDALCARMRRLLDGPLQRSGLHLARFEIENLTGPLEVGLHPTSKRTQTLTHVARSLLGTTGEPMRTSELVPCIQCGVSLPVGARFCTACGTAQRKTCVQCGSALPARARFCSRCGSGQPS